MAVFPSCGMQKYPFLDQSLQWNYTFTSVVIQRLLPACNAQQKLWWWSRVLWARNLSFREIKRCSFYFDDLKQTASLHSRQIQLYISAYIQCFVHFSTLVSLTHLPIRYWSQNSYLCFMASFLSYIITISIDLTTSLIKSTSSIYLNLHLGLVY